MASNLISMGFRRPPGPRGGPGVVVLGLAVGLALITACGPVDPVPRLPATLEPEKDSAPPVEDRGGLPGQTLEDNLPDQREDRLVPAVPTQLERVTPLGETPITGEVPAELLDAVLTDLAGRQQVERAQITVLEAQQVLWPDGSLGCPQPGQAYTQAQVEGYRVVLGAGAAEYDYRLSWNGFIVLCEGPLLPP